MMISIDRIYRHAEVLLLYNRLTDTSSMVMMMRMIRGASDEVQLLQVTELANETTNQMPMDGWRLNKGQCDAV